MATIRDTFASVGTITISLASLASSAVGVGRQGTLVDNTTNRYRSALVSCTIKMGTTPTANTLVNVYLVRSNNDGTAIIDDGAGPSDAGLTVVNAPLLGSLVCPSTSTGTVLKGTFDTSPLGPLGPKWTIAVINSSGAALDSTGGNHVCSFVGITGDVA